MLARELLRARPYGAMSFRRRGRLTSAGLAATPWRLSHVFPSVIPASPTSIAGFVATRQAILLTAGGKGASYSIGGHKGFVPSFRSCDIVETTGAGDAFSAGVIAKCVQLMSNSIAERGGEPGKGLLGGAEWDAALARETVRFGSAVGALTCGGDGAIAPQPSLEQVHRLLSVE